MLLLDLFCILLNLLTGSYGVLNGHPLSILYIGAAIIWTGVLMIDIDKRKLYKLPNETVADFLKRVFLNF